MPIIKCSYCGKDVYKQNNQIAKVKNSFCSKKCHDLFRTKKIKSYCFGCGKEILIHPSRKTKRNFCSIKCTFLGNIVKCDYCGNNIYKSKADLKHSKNHFCSTDCRNKFKRIPNRYINYGLITKLLITSKKHGVKEVILDTKNVNIVNKYQWTLTFDKRTGNFYVTSNTFGKKQRLHRLISKCPNNLIPDHINGNGLDNREINLRNIPVSCNPQNKPKLVKTNTSGFRGVSYRKRDDVWVASVRHNKKTHCKCFKNKNDAIEYAVYLRKKILPYSTN